VRTNKQEQQENIKITMYVYVHQKKRTSTILVLSARFVPFFGVPPILEVVANALCFFFFFFNVGNNNNKQKMDVNTPVTHRHQK
jgi:hypothetical protein